MYSLISLHSSFVSLSVGVFISFAHHRILKTYGSAKYEHSSFNLPILGYI